MVEMTSNKNEYSGMYMNMHVQIFLQLLLPLSASILYLIKIDLPFFVRLNYNAAIIIIPLSMQPNSSPKFHLEWYKKYGKVFGYVLSKWANYILKSLRST